jgi:hypothetical protein
MAAVLWRESVSFPPAAQWGNPNPNGGNKTRGWDGMIMPRHSLHEMTGDGLVIHMNLANGADLDMMPFVFRLTYYLRGHVAMPQCILTVVACFPTCAAIDFLVGCNNAR